MLLTAVPLVIDEQLRSFKIMNGYRGALTLKEALQPLAVLHGLIVNYLQRRSLLLGIGNALIRGYFPFATAFAAAGH